MAEAGIFGDTGIRLNQGHSASYQVLRQPSYQMIGYTIPTPCMAQ